MQGHWDQGKNEALAQSLYELADEIEAVAEEVRDAARGYDKRYVPSSEEFALLVSIESLDSQRTPVLDHVLQSYGLKERVV